MRISPNQLNKLPPQTAEKLLKEQCFHDVLLLLENLVKREELTFKIILSCLYDVGSANLINQKCNLHGVNQVLKLIARMSKPAFRIMAWYWFKNNCPQLIANWLHQQVEFKKSAQSTPEIVVENQPETSQSLTLAPSPNQEVKYLRSQIRLLIGILVAAIATFSGSLFWMGYEMKRSHLQAIEELKIQLQTHKITTNQP